MATVTRGTTYGATEQITNTKLHLLVDGATVTGIVDADIAAGAGINDTKLDLATIAQAIQFNGATTFASTQTMSASIFKWAKGADVASVAGTITLGDDGNYFDITGTNAITSITAKTAGTFVVLQFDSTASLVDGSNLKLNGNFQGAAESHISLVSDGTSWFEVCRQPYVGTAANALTGSVVQTVNTQSGAMATGTTTIPDDDTIPQNTEGTEFMSKAITPNNASNLMKIDVVAYISGGANIGLIGALFQDTTANALAAMRRKLTDSQIGGGPITFTHYMTAGTTSSTTFKFRAGPMTADTITFNGDSGGRKLGGVMASSITITEIKA
jgi:hypothetical protein